MYAKWINPKKIIPFTSDLLRHGGKITIHPSAEDLIGAGYYPVILGGEEDLNAEENVFIEKNKQILVLREENIE